MGVGVGILVFEQAQQQTGVGIAQDALLHVAHGALDVGDLGLPALAHVVEELAHGLHDRLPRLPGGLELLLHWGLVAVGHRGLGHGCGRHSQGHARTPGPGTRRGPGWRVAALHVYENMVAVLLQLRDLALVLDHEALKQERRLHPGAVELGDVHATRELLRRDLDLVHMERALHGERILQGPYRPRPAGFEVPAGDLGGRAPRPSTRPQTVLSTDLACEALADLGFEPRYSLAEALLEVPSERFAWFGPGRRIRRLPHKGRRAARLITQRRWGG